MASAHVPRRAAHGGSATLPSNFYVDRSSPSLQTWLIGAAILVVLLVLITAAIGAAWWLSNKMLPPDQGSQRGAAVLAPNTKGSNSPSNPQPKKVIQGSSFLQSQGVVLDQVQDFSGIRKVAEKIYLPLKALRMQDDDEYLRVCKEVQIDLEKRLKGQEVSFSFTGKKGINNATQRLLLIDVRSNCFFTKDGIHNNLAVLFDNSKERSTKIYEPSFDKARFKFAPGGDAGSVTGKITATIMAVELPSKYRTIHDYDPTGEIAPPCIVLILANPRAE